MKPLFALSVSLGVLLGAAGAARADVFVLTNDNGGDGYVTSIAGGFDVVGGNNGVPNTTNYLAVASTNETVSFNWSYSTQDSGAGFDPAGYVLNGAQIQLSTDLWAGPGTNLGNGTVSFSVSAGQNYGVYVYTVDGFGGAGDIAVTDLVVQAAPSPLPGAGIAGLAVLILAFAARTRGFLV